MWEFWVDRGGTFTDIVARTPQGAILTRKLLSESSHGDDDAAVQGIRDLLGLAGAEPIPPGTITSVKMGTTVATNALLERSGARTLLLITEGFGDLLRIGTQARPQLFELNIRLPDLLYERVVEVPERLDAAGNEVRALDEDAARQALVLAHADGINAVAIAFMHGYCNPAHEARVEALAAEVGFSQISVSHKVSPLIKLVPRGDTTVVDAYLSPNLRHYVNQVSSALATNERSATRLLFMQSNGGLTDAAHFQGKDAILSGPAGGVVGMIKTGQAAGYDKLIGFDMGGTSTDVCHFAGEYERSFETEVAGVRLRAPMMHIHTVAAGGGSILAFKDGRYQVGPESAAANPGPACYRQGGPLTVTDCNVMLGRLQPTHFPSVFGPSADQPIDQHVVRDKFVALAEKIASETGTPVREPETIAAGFLRVAVENMANAIKKISVRRGYDVSDYTLQCFGGAGGQHACQVANALGIQRILVHPLAGVLSAYGMGLAEIRCLREESFELPLMNTAIAQAHLEALASVAVEDIERQGVERNNVDVFRRAHLRYRGSHQALEVDFGTATELVERFEKRHQARFGFVDRNREVVFESLAVEAVGNDPSNERTAWSIRRESDATAEPLVDSKPVGSGSTLPIFDRARLVASQIIAGPAIIVEPTGTNVIDPDWQAKIDEFDNLVLTRSAPQNRREAIGTDADPVMLEVFNNLFMSIAEQMGATLANTAYSANIKERLDFSCALFDPNGGLVANAPHVPVHLGSMSESIRSVIRQNPQMERGDVFVMNAPFNGGTHLPDVTVVTPVFDEADEKALFFVASRGHHADIGGKTPGSSPPDSKHIEEEGVLIDNFKLVSAGQMRASEMRALLTSGSYPCRNVDENMADLAAQLAANKTGVREVRRMIEQFGLTTVHAYMQHVQDNAAACIERVIGQLQDGSARYELDDGAKICVAVRVDKQNRTAVIDFSGTSDKHPTNYNAPLAVCHAVVLYAFRSLVGNRIPLNEGCFRPLRIIAPEGSMIHAQYPAAVIAGNTEVSQHMCNALFEALGALAHSQGTMNNFVWGNSRIQNYETLGGGMGAGPGFDGCSAIQTHMTNTRATDPEILELRFPVRLEEWSIRRGSGGKGRHRGGDGMTRKLRFLEPMTVTTLCSHRLVPPKGAAGGGPGEVGSEWIERADGTIAQHSGNDRSEVEIGDLFVMKTPSGGGFGANPR